MSTLGERLRSAREKKGWSQTYVCEKLNISNSRLSGYERDYREPDFEMLKTLANLYEVSTDYLLGTEDKTIKEPQGEYNFTDKDERDIAKRMEQIKKDLIEANQTDNVDGLNFYGEPMSEEAVDSLLEAMEYIVRQTQRINKKYIPKKYRKDEEHEE